MPFAAAGGSVFLCGCLSDVCRVSGWVGRPILVLHDQWMTDDYKPLPDSLEIGNSGIHGQGVFARNYIPAGTDLGVTHYVWPVGVLRTPLGGFLNHSDTPNCRKMQGGTWVRLVTGQGVLPGEELTVSYTLVAPPV